MTETLRVFLGGKYAGQLTREDSNEDPSFTYDRAYSAAANTPLSVRLPLTTKTYAAPRVLPYLAGLLPEDPNTRARWAESAGAAVDDSFALLSNMGLDCPGAVQFFPPDNVNIATSRQPHYEPCSEADIAARIRGLAEDSASWAMPEEHWSLGGQQEKFALTLLDGAWHQAHGSGATTHIIKPGIKHLLHQSLIEHVTQVAAARMGLAVATSSFVAFEDQWAIVSQRYDRQVTDGRITRLHQEDFCQAVGRMPDRKYESRGGPTLREMAQVVERHASDRAEARHALADFVIINVVAGAPDGHSKNISLLYTGFGLQVAPLYDLATGLAYDKTDVERAAALSVGGERTSSRIYPKQWLAAAKIVKMPGDAFLRRVEELALGFPLEYAGVLEELAAEGVPGADDVLERSAEPMIRHCLAVASRLG